MLESLQDDVVIVLTTLGADINAVQLATTLVEERLAACVNILPEMDSIFRWQGAVERDSERQLLIKTRRERLEGLAARLLELHPYEVPELLVLPVREGGEAYVRWLRGAVEAGQPPAPAADA